MSPEQASGKTERISTAADTYSLGAVLYSMLTGHPPFHGDTPFETIHKVVHEDPKHPTSLNGDIDYDLATICLKCLEKDPQQRYASAGALAQDLERWMRREPIEARPTGKLGKVCRWCRREPALATMTAGMVVLLLASAATVSWFFWKQAKDAKERSEMTRREMIRQLYDAWKDPDQSRVRISADQLDVIFKRPTPRFIKMAPTPLNFGIHPSSPQYRSPEKLAEQYAHVLTFLETNNPAALLRFDLHIFKNPAHLAEALGKTGEGAIHLARLSPSAYVSGRKGRTNILILAQQLHHGQPRVHGAFFTHTNSNLQNLADLQDRTLGFPDRAHSFGDRVPKALLRDLGLRLAHLQDCSNSPIDQLLRMVSEQRLDVAVVQLEPLEETIRAGAPFKKLTNLTSSSFPWVAGSQLDPALLRTLQQKLTNLTSVSFPWVAGSQLEPAVARVLQQSLFALTNPLVLLTIERDLTGFGPARPQDYIEVEEEMQKAIDFDEQQRPPQPLK